MAYFVTYQELQTYLLEAWPHVQCFDVLLKSLCLCIAALSLAHPPPPYTHSCHVFDYVHVKAKKGYFDYVKERLHFGFVPPARLYV